MMLGIYRNSIKQKGVHDMGFILCGKVRILFLYVINVQGIRLN